MPLSISVLAGAIIIAFAIGKIGKKIDGIKNDIHGIFQIMGGEVKSILEKGKSTELLGEEIGKIYKNKYKVSQEKAKTWGAQRINAEGYEKSLEILKNATEWPIFDRDVFPNNEQSFKKALDTAIEKERKDK